MPGSGRRNNRVKKSPKPMRDLSSVDIPTVLDSQVDLINDTASWDSVVRMLCDMFDLPDLDSRKGLKAVHNNFDEIQRNLSNAYSKYANNYKVAGAIVGIWSKMSKDTILRNKVWDTGLLPKLLSLIEDPRTRLVGMQALSCVTCSGGNDIRGEIVKQAPTLLRLMNTFPDDPVTREQVVVTLSHAAASTIAQTDSASSVAVASPGTLNLPEIVDCVFQAVKKPGASSNMLTHAIEFLCSSVWGCPREIKADSSLVNLLVALLRANDISIRAGALAALIRLALLGSEPDNRDMNTARVLESIQNGFPESLEEYMLDYDPTQCETLIACRVHAEFTGAMVHCAQDKNFYSLGRKLAELIVTSEYAIGDGGFEVVNERTGRRETMSPGVLPFTTLPDSLPYCASALREHGSPVDLDATDVLECKFLVMRRRVSDAVHLAERATERSPQIAYFYYVISLTADHIVGLRAAKKGLKARRASPSVRQCLLCRAVEHAMELGLEKLQNAHPGDIRYKEGVAFFNSALEDATTFCSETPPDHRRMPTIVNWYILLSIALLGPKISVDLEELKNAFNKLDATREVGRFFGVPETKTQLRLARELIVARYKRANTEWRGFIGRLNSLDSHSHEDALAQSASKATDNLAAWLEGLNLQGDDDDRVHDAHSYMSAGRLSGPELLQCSYCLNPSAVLKKCSACKKTVYCDSSCQTLHWREHKVACKAAQANSRAQ